MPTSKNEQRAEIIRTLRRVANQMRWLSGTLYATGDPLVATYKQQLESDARELDNAIKKIRSLCHPE